MTVADAVIEELAAGEAAALERVAELEADVMSQQAEILILQSENAVLHDMVSLVLGDICTTTTRLSHAQTRIRADRAVSRRDKAAA